MLFDRKIFIVGCFHPNVLSGEIIGVSYYVTGVIVPKDPGDRNKNLSRRKTLEFRTSELCLRSLCAQY
jgi:hypothetical protein